MAVVNFKDKIWAATIMRTLENNLVAKKICNTQFTGTVKRHGDAVYFNGLADPSINAYTGSTLTYEELQDSRITLLVDQANSFSFKVGDIEAAQAMIDLKGSQAQRAAYGLANTCDAYILGLYAGANNDVSSVTVTSANVLSTVGAFQQKLAENNVGDKDMWMVIPPWLRLKLQLAGVNFSINEGTAKGSGGGMAWTDDLGFDIYVSNNVANNGSTTSYVMAGSYNAIALADQLVSTEYIRSNTTFDDYVRGLHVFGAKVVKPDELVKSALTVGSESAI